MPEPGPIKFNGHNSPTLKEQRAEGEHRVRLKQFFRHAVDNILPKRIKNISENIASLESFLFKTKIEGNGLQQHTLTVKKEALQRAIAQKRSADSIRVALKELIYAIILILPLERVEELLRSPAEIVDFLKGGKS